MLKLSNKQRYYWLGFIIIAVIYSLYNLYLVDVSYYQSIPRKIRHVGKLVAVLTIYGTGTFALKKYTGDWMMFIWHMIHIVIITLLLLIGIYDWTFGAVTMQIRNIADTLFEFLISPVIYIAVGILNSKFGKAEKNV
ncbi:hypothetical protein HDF18_04585 [Mucilaginibacter sp. X5P1]|uniref:hypothetical protein n=1 Tax=Mucilaginibacter sp. X5P1 TaxID=2723088 RepID=UPI0016178843|nr:hypothetical protein [Mucilaginibacter sp. X5P1]MBB6136898.1 hypothetical protein [Mucilaginibacter sp. X5P1]